MEDPNENNAVNEEEGRDVESPPPELSLSSSQQQQQQQLQTSLRSSSSTSSSGIGGGNGGGGAAAAPGGTSQQQQQYPYEFYCPITKLLMKDPVVLADGLSYERSSAESKISKAEEAEAPLSNSHNDSSNTDADDTADTGGGGDGFETVEEVTTETTATTNTNSTTPMIVMYSNRSLKLIIEESTRTTLQKFSHSAKQFLVGGNIQSGGVGVSVSPSSSSGLDSSRHSSVVVVTAQPLSNAFYCPITLGLMYEPVIDPQGYTYERVAIENWIANNGDSPVTREPLTVQDLIANKAISNLLEREANRKDTENIHPAILKWMNEAPPVLSTLELSTRTTTTNYATPTEVGTYDTTITNNNNNNNAVAAVTRPFPLTRHEFELQQQMSIRNQRNRMITRLALVVFALGVIVAGFFVPIIAAIALVLVVIGIVLVTKDAAN